MKITTVWNYGRKKQLALLVLLDIFGGLQNLFMALVSSRFILAATNRSMHIFVTTALSAIIGFAVFTIFSYFQVTVRNAFIQDINLHIKKMLIKSIMENNPGGISTDKVISLFTNDLKLFETNGITSELTLIEQTIILIFAIVGGIYFDFPSTVVFAIGSVVPVLISRRLHPKIVKQSTKWSEKNNQFTGMIKDTLLGIESIRNYLAQPISEQRLNHGAINVEDSLNAMNSAKGHVTVITMFAALVFAFVLPFTFGIYRVVNGVITLATFMGVVQISNYIVNPLLSGLSAFNTIGTTQEIKQRIIHLTVNTSNSESQPLPINPPEFINLSLNDIDINRGNKSVISDFSLQVNVGDHVLIKGPSGIGKSTILRTLQGSVLAKSGQYLLNNVDVTSGIPDDFQQMFAYIRQQPILFDDTIAYNLTLGRKFASHSINQAIKRSGLEQLVQEKGIDYPVGEMGKNLSGGQAQRIEIARALLYGYPVILADEISSALDDEMAKKIHDTLFSSGKTIIEVAHHLDKETEDHFTKIITL